MSRDDDFTSGVGEELKKDIKNIYKHSKRAIKGFFKGGNRRNNFGRRQNWCPPMFAFKSPLLMLLWPKIIVAGIILLALLLCGVSLYGVIIILLLTLIFILI